MDYFGYIDSLRGCSLQERLASADPILVRAEARAWSIEKARLAARFVVPIVDYADYLRREPDRLVYHEADTQALHWESLARWL